MRHTPDSICCNHSIYKIKEYLLFCSMIRTAFDFCRLACSCPSVDWVHETFHVLRNAITVPHSVLTIAVAFLSITGERIDPLQLVRQAWAAPLTALNTVVFHQGDFVHFVKNTYLHQWLQANPTTGSEVFEHVNCRGQVHDMFFEKALPRSTPGSSIGRSCFNGPADLVDQLALVNSDAKGHMHLPVETFAGLAQDWDISVGLCKLGNCQLDSPPQDVTTEVIEISPTLPFAPADHADAPQGDEYEWKSFVDSDFFQVVQPVIETLQDDTTTKENTIAIVQQDAMLCTTFWCTSSDVQQCIQKCSTIDGFFSSTLARVRGMIIALLQRIQPANKIPITVFEANCDPPQATIGQVDSAATTAYPISIRASEMSIRLVNGQALDQHTTLHAGDFVLCIPKTTIYAGGHHDALVPPPSLPAGSTLSARLEFMTNTHGWMASDEMFFYTQDLMWMQQELKFSLPAMWDIHKTSFDETGYGEPCIFNNATTVIPIMIRSHWGAAKRDGRTFVTLVQVHEDFRQG